MAKARTLTDALALLAEHGPYPADHPQTLAELMEADPATVTHPFGQALLGMTVEAIRLQAPQYVRGPKDALRLLIEETKDESGRARPPLLTAWSGRWVSYALTGSRQIHKVSVPGGGVRSMRKATALLPKAEDLPDLPWETTRYGKKPGWLVIYGGTPEVLSKPHVAKGLATLRRRVPVADIVFFDGGPGSDGAPTLWSVAAGCGITKTGGRDGTEVPFPDLEALAEVRSA